MTLRGGDIGGGDKGGWDKKDKGHGTKRTGDMFDRGHPGGGLPGQVHEGRVPTK